MTQQGMNKKSLSHDRLTDQFDALMNEYDVNRRLDVLIDEFLQTVNLKDRLILEAGCGTGRGSQRFSSLGARVVSLDIGFNLVNYTRQRCKCEPTVASILRLPFPDNLFDGVFSTEVIEHTPDPLQAVSEMYRVVRPGGHLIISTPNWLWQAPVRFASLIKLRPYDGFENFVKPTQLRQTLINAGGKIMAHKGIHLLPFQFAFAHPLLRKLDNYGHILLPVMINQCLHCRKPV